MKCPYCKGKETWRMPRQRWMWYTPGNMKNTRCSTCGAEFTLWIGFIPLRHSTARRLTSLWHIILLAAICIAVGCVIPQCF